MVCLNDSPFEHGVFHSFPHICGPPVMVILYWKYHLIQIAYNLQGGASCHGAFKPSSINKTQHVHYNAHVIV